VGAENYSRIIRYLIQFLHKHGALVPEGIDYVFIMYDLVADVDRGTEEFQGTFYNLDGPVNAGTKSTGIGKYDLHNMVCNQFKE